MNDLLKLATITAAALALPLAITGCKEEKPKGDSTLTTTTNGDHDDDADHDHDHADGDHDHDDHDGMDDDDHDHGEEVDLGSTTIGPWTVECAQSHGNVEAGKEGHLVVKLPFNDNGQTTVRAWIGTNDRLSSMVGRGEYAPSHDDYDIHANAPDPLPADAKWWIEIEKPDGTKAVGSIAFK